MPRNQTNTLLTNMYASNNAIDAQFTATNANINNVGRDTAIGFMGVSKDICDLGSKVDMNTLILSTQADNNTQKILTEMANDREQALRDQLAAVTLKSEFANRGLLEATGPNAAFIQNKCPEDTTGRDIQIQIANLNNQIANLGGIVANAVGQGGIQK